VNKIYVLMLKIRYLCSWFERGE